MLCTLPEQIPSQVEAKLGHVTPEELRGLCAELRGGAQGGWRHQALLELGEAVALTLGEEAATSWEAVAAVEKILMLSAGDPGMVASQLTELANRAAEEPQPLVDLHVSLGHWGPQGGTGG